MPGQLGPSEVNATWRSASINPVYFIDVFTECGITAAALDKPEEKLSESGFEVVGKQEVTHTTLSDQAIILLANHLDIKLPGLPLFVSAYPLISLTPPKFTSIDCIETSNNSFLNIECEATPLQSEPDIALATRKLSALSAPLFPDNDAGSAEDENELYLKLNDWHRTINKTASPLDQALAATAYYYHQDSGKLVIRHAPLDITNEKENANPYQIVIDVTAIIRAHITATEAIPLQIEHVIPLIKDGRVATIESSVISVITLGYHNSPVTSWGTHSRHIVLQCIDDEMLQEICKTPDSEESSETGIVDPRQAFFDPKDFADNLAALLNLKSTTSLGAQSFWDDVNCGRFVALMAPIAALILAKYPEKKGCELTKADFEPYKHHIISAHNLEFLQLKKLLLDLEQKTSEQMRIQPHSKEFLTSIAARVAVATRHAFLERIPPARATISVPGMSLSPSN